jgi:methyltransferase (TIGR00027 family)
VEPVSADEVPEGVGRTAVGMALLRAGESARPDRLFDDPLALAFVEAAPDAFAEEEAAADAEVLGALAAAFAFHGAIRTRFYDDYLVAAGCQQAVFVAAGLDTRAFRLSWPARTHVWELDQADVLAFKERILDARGAVPHCARRIVAVDLRVDWAHALEDAGFDPRIPTAWLVEGLLTYLNADEAARLLVTITARSAPGSRVAFELGAGVSDELLARARDLPTMARYTSMFKDGLGADAGGWLAGHGWDVETHDLLDVASAYGREPPSDTTGGFITATRRARDPVRDRVGRAGSPAGAG